MTESEIIDSGFQHVLLATGSEWRKDGFGRINTSPIPGWDAPHVFSATQVLGGTPVAGSVVVFDDDHYYLGGVIAQHLKGLGHNVALITPASEVSSWTKNTAEQVKIQSQIMEQGIEIFTNRNIVQINKDNVELSCVYTGKTEIFMTDSVVMVTSRTPRDSLYYALTSDMEKLHNAGIETVKQIGDCYCPGIIAAAVHDGYRAAVELEAGEIADVPFRRERVQT